MLYNIYQSSYFWWIVGWIVGQIYFVIEAPFYNIKRWQGFLFGVINLIMLIIGAKIMYVIENFEHVLTNGITLMSGFSLFGAIFIQALSCLIIKLIFKKNFWQVASMLIIPFVIMLGFYRIDCYRNGCCGGISINGFTPPVQIIEIILCLTLAVSFTIISHKKNFKNGECFIWYYIIYGAVRFIICFFRVNTYLFWIISVSQIWCLISVAIGLTLLLYRKKHNF